jgi:hypothetical protein
MFIDYDKYNDSVINNYREIKEITDGLIAHYKFNGNDIDMLLDSSGNSHNLINHGGIFNNTDFISGNGSLELDGTYLEIPDTINPYNIWNNKGITFSCWFKILTTSETNCKIFSFGYNLENDYFNNQISVSNFNKKILFMIISAGNYIELYETPSDYVDNEWHFLSWSIDITGNWKIYLDNVLQETNIQRPITNFTLTSRYIGYDNVGFSIIYKGNIDDFRIYDRVLSVLEVEKLYNTQYIQKSIITDSTDEVVSFKYNPNNNNSGQTKYTINFPQNTECDILIVGGGGSGGNWDGGGGGAGGVIYATGVDIPAGTYTIKVGNGGDEVTTDHTSGNNGYGSEFLGAVALGGGGGGCGDNLSANPNGKDGGSGGGGGFDNPVRDNQGSSIQEKTQSNFSSTYGNLYSYLNATGTFNVYGNHGGHGNNDNNGYPNDAMGGGGGGAGSAGIDGDVGTNPGNGGDGIEINITGTNVWYAGGGGGAGDSSVGIGGSGIGGSGGGDVYNPNIMPGDGVAHTGSGGGGVGWGAVQAPYDYTGKGGSGIVIIRYKTLIQPIIKIYDTKQYNHFNQYNFNLTNSNIIELQYFKKIDDNSYHYSDHIGYDKSTNIKNIVFESLNITSNTILFNCNFQYDYNYDSNEYISKKVKIQVNIPAIGYLIDTNIDPEPFFITDIESSIDKLYPSTYARQIYFNSTNNEYDIENSFYDNGKYIINYSSYNEDLSPINLFYKPNPETYESHEAIWAENNYQNGIYIGNNNLGGINGDWITIQMPNKILLTKYLFVTYSYLTFDESKSKLPKKYSIFGCNNNDNNWEKIYDDNIPDISNINKNYTYYDYENTNTEYTEDNIAYEKILNSSDRLTGDKLFNTYGLVVNETFNSTQLAMAEWELYGKVPSVFYEKNLYLYKNLHIKQDLIALSTHSSPSDKKLKTNITFLSNCNQLINKLNPISFQWKNDTNFISPKYYNKNDVGFLAQEVQQILPIIVKDSYYKNISYKKLNETKIIAYLINVIKNIHNRIEILEKNI